MHVKLILIVSQIEDMGEMDMVATAAMMMGFIPV